MNYELLLGIDDDDAALRSPLYECIMSNQSQPCISLVEVTCYFALEMEQTNRSAISQKYQLICNPIACPGANRYRAVSGHFPSIFRAVSEPPFRSSCRAIDLNSSTVFSVQNFLSFPAPMDAPYPGSGAASSFRAVSEQFQSNASTAPR